MVDLALDAAIGIGQTDVFRGPTPKSGKLHARKVPPLPSFAPTASFLASPLSEWVRKLSPNQLVWDPVAGSGGITRALRSHELTVFSSDRRNFNTSGVDDTNIDILAPRIPPAPPNTAGIIGFPYDHEIPPARLVARGLEYIQTGQIEHIAYLLPYDFDFITRRYPLFATSNFHGKVVLTYRPRWLHTKKVYNRNYWSWFCWGAERVPHARICYAPESYESWFEDPKERPQLGKWNDRRMEFVNDEPTDDSRR